MLQSRVHMSADIRSVNAHRPSALSPNQRSEGQASDWPTRVLVVNDDESMHRQLANFLESHTMRVFVSGLRWNVIERRLTTDAPDVIVVDIPAGRTDWV